MAIYYCSIFIISTSGVAKLIQNEAWGVVVEMLSDATVWIVLILVPILAVVPDFLIVTIKSVFFPNCLQLHRALAVHPNKAFIE